MSSWLLFRSSPRHVVDSEDHSCLMISVMVVGLSAAAGRFLVGNGDGSGDADAHKFDNMMWDGDQDGARSTGDQDGARLDGDQDGARPTRWRSRWCQINWEISSTEIKMVKDQRTANQGAVEDGPRNWHTSRMRVHGEGDRDGQLNVNRRH